MVFTSFSYLVTHNSSKDSLEFLKWPDFVKLVATVAAWAEHLTVDAVYLTGILKDTLQVRPGDSGDTKYKRRLLSYLLSHVVAWFASCPLLSVKILQEINDVNDSMKLRVLLPLLDALAKSPSNVLGRLPVNHRESYAAGLLSSFQGKEVGSFMNADSSKEWETLRELARIGLKGGKRGFTSRESASHSQYTDRFHRNFVPPPCGDTLCV